MSGSRGTGGQAKSSFFSFIPTCLCPEMLFTKDKQKSCLSTILLLFVSFLRLQSSPSTVPFYSPARQRNTERKRRAGGRQERNQSLEQCAPISLSLFLNSPDVVPIVQEDVIACTQAHVTKGKNPHQSHDGREYRGGTVRTVRRSGLVWASACYRAASFSRPCSARRRYNSMGIALRIWLRSLLTRWTREQ